MLEHVHSHITKELEQNTKTDTIFILTSIILNLITLAVNVDAFSHVYFCRTDYCC
jgi:hypothetical protein